MYTVHQWISGTKIFFQQERQRIKHVSVLIYASIQIMTNSSEELCDRVSTERHVTGIKSIYIKQVRNIKVFFFLFFFSFLISAVWMRLHESISKPTFFLLKAWRMSHEPACTIFCPGNCLSEKVTENHYAWTYRFVHEVMFISQLERNQITLMNKMIGIRSADNIEWVYLCVQNRTWVRNCCQICLYSCCITMLQLYELIYNSNSCL